MPSTSADAPPAVGSTLTHTNATFSLVDFLFSGVFVRFPDLKVAYSEGQIGWIPYILERADRVWEENRGWGGVADIVPEKPSSYFQDHVYGCFFDDAHGLRSVDEIGEDNITYESDYPHSDSTWPHTRQIAEEQMARPDRRAAAQDRPGQRHQALRPRPRRLIRAPTPLAHLTHGPALHRAEQAFRGELRAWLAATLPGGRRRHRRTTTGRPGAPTTCTGSACSSTPATPASTGRPRAAAAARRRSSS